MKNNNYTIGGEIYNLPKNKKIKGKEQQVRIRMTPI